MTPTSAIAAQPTRPPALRRSEIIGLRIAITQCGPPIDAGTLFQLSSGVYLAERQLDRIEAIWRRYARRFGLAGAEIEDGPARLAARYHVVRQIYEQRAEHSRLLIRDPIAGSA